MHQSLALSNLDQLHLALRRRALAAAGGNIDKLEALTRSGANLTPLLPVYYVGLDAAAIPGLLDQLDAPEAERDQSFTQKLAQVVLCLQGLLLIGNRGIPGPPSADLWERVWPWLEFLDTYGDYLPRRLRPGLGISDYSPLHLINALGQDQATFSLIPATPGYRLLIFRVWALAFDQTKPVPMQKELFGMICALMRTMPPTITDERHSEEAIEGSGGSRLTLARLYINHIKRVVQPAEVTPEAVSMWNLLSLLQAGCEMDVTFGPLLVKQGIVTAFTSVACLFSSSTPDTAAFFLSWMVKHCFGVSHAENTIAEALRAGLLRALLVWGRMSPPTHHVQLNEIFALFSRSSVYISFLLQLRASMAELEVTIDGQTFHGFPVSDKWESLWSVLQPRCDFMEEYLKREKTAILVPCSSMACGVIAHKTAFKRCSVCKSCKYCSKACQTHDWQHGGHRQLCGWNCGEPDKVTRRNRSFMLALLHRDYLRMKRSILTDELEFLRLNPGMPFYVQFDYCTPYSAVEISVEAVSSFALDDEIWRDQNTRVKESGGRLEMHVMRVADGGRDSISTFLLCSTGELRTGLESLAADTAVTGADSREQADRMEIHRLAELDMLEVYG
ncbi:hypothetical protein C8R45DRAFT_976599 [Mycena sanguinolenta]|nr:hypothetical protein C8R45DRAFT_976599 [Mycena sanguinolenta]